MGRRRLPARGEPRMSAGVIAAGDARFMADLDYGLAPSTTPSTAPG